MSFCLIFWGNDKPLDLDFLEADDQILVSYSQSIEQNIINTKTQTPTFNFNNCVVQHGQMNILMTVILHLLLKYC